MALSFFFSLNREESCRSDSALGANFRSPTRCTKRTAYSENEKASDPRTFVGVCTCTCTYILQARSTAPHVHCATKSGRFYLGIMISSWDLDSIFRFRFVAPYPTGGNTHSSEPLTMPGLLVCSATARVARSPASRRGGSPGSLQDSGPAHQ